MIRPYVRILTLVLLLIAAWVLWSGYLKPLLLGLGALSCVLTVWIVRRMGYFDDETFAFHYDWRLLGFWLWLGREVVKSSIEVAQVVLRRRIDVEPQLVDIDGSALGPVTRSRSPRAR
jgi:multicomponent Na+:H+ antiporter subunit E